MSAKQQKCIEKMKDVNAANWQYYVNKLVGKDSKTGKLKVKSNPINDLESIIIHKAMKAIDQDANLPQETRQSAKFLELITLELKINLYSVVVTNKKGELKHLTKAVSNHNRERPK